MIFIHKSFVFVLFFQNIKPQILNNHENDAFEINEEASKLCLYSSPVLKADFEF